MEKKRKKNEAQKKQEEQKQRQDEAVAIRSKLMALVLEMSSVTTESEAKAGLERLAGLRASMEAAGSGGAISAQARQALEDQIAWLEVRLRHLRETLGRQRRYQEGEAMEKRAREAALTEDPIHVLDPLLHLPEHLVDAVVGKTLEKDAEPEAPRPVTGQQVHAVKQETPQEKPRRQAEKEPEKRPEPARQPEPVKQPEPPKPEPVKQPEQAKQPPREAVVWTKNEKLAAHLAASVLENPAFFEELRRLTKNKGPKLAAPKDNAEAEAHFRSIHNIGIRLVNVELHCKAIAEASKKGQPLGRMLQTGAREIGNFLRDYQAAREARPDQAAEYERIFGGYVKAFSTMKPEKGAQLLAQAQAEANPVRKPRHAEAEAPQLVLHREDPWN